MMICAGAAISVAPLAATAAMAIACAVLSVFVVARRWAFIGEGISHSGFGGAGLAWLLMLAVPTLAGLPALPYLAVILFCIGTALAIGYISRGNRVTGDAAIGVFLVASLAFGFLAQQIYRHVRGRDPVDFQAFLIGRAEAIEPTFAVIGIITSIAVLITLAALGKEILAYCFDPQMAEASGVRVGFIHYLLMVLIAVTIIIGMPVIGAPLVTALLVLPGVTGTLVSQRLPTVLAIAIAASLIGAVTGVFLNAAWPFIPIGPAIVLTLFVLFVVAYVAARLRSASTT
jgi:ABC-type Mn2+/Zn2+ transport system permease subunit